MQIMVSRDEGTAMHSAMVEQIARRILNVVMKKRPELLIGTFGYENVVEVLEKQGRGLNLTWEVRDGILNHRTAGHPSTLEGAIVRLSDKIAYINHDNSSRRFRLFANIGMLFWDITNPGMEK